MVKAIRVKVKKAAGKAKEKDSRSHEDVKAPVRQAPVRVQRKLLKRAAFLEKLSASQPTAQSRSAGVQKKKKRRPSVALSNLKSLADSLDQAARFKGQHQSGAAVNTLKARERITKDESARLQQVVQHPEFQNDPLAAITSHLSATLPPPPPAPRPKMDKKQRKLEKKRRAQMAKANAASNDMAE